MKISVIYLLEDTNMKVSGKNGDARIWKSNKQQSYWGVHIDKTLSFDEHVSNLCKKAGRKLCFSKVVDLYDSNTKESPNEIFH